MGPRGPSGPPGKNGDDVSGSTCLPKYCPFCIRQTTYISSILPIIAHVILNIESNLKCFVVEL